MRFIVSILSFLFCSVVLAGPNYEAEIDKYIVRPCWTEAAIRNGVDETIGLEQAIELLMILQADGRRTMIDAALPTAKTLNRKNRLLFYEMGKAACIGGLEK